MRALVAVGGYGTRLFPATKAVPKAMLPVAGKPLLQHVVEELATCGIVEIGILCRRSQTTIVEHFKSSAQLKRFLSRSKAQGILAEISSIDHLVHAEFIFCDGSSCLGDALRLAQHFVGSDPFVLALGDEIGARGSSPIPRLLELYEHYRCTVGACRGLRDEAYRVTSTMWDELNHAVAAYRRKQHTLEDCIDVPDGVMIGRYVCASDLFPALETLGRSDFVPDFIDAFGHLAACGRLVAMPFAADWWHCGDAVQLLRAVIDHAVTDPHTGRQVREYLQRRLLETGPG